ncbi:hypothetical protein H4R35_007268 [Dimargaris xerosporica]|nr:hypothetical protein H4R35_007268 [Dimargaris xerosporica]
MVRAVLVAITAGVLWISRTIGHPTGSVVHILSKPHGEQASPGLPLLNPNRRSQYPVGTTSQRPLTAKGQVNADNLLPNNAWSNWGLADKAKRLILALGDNLDVADSFDDSAFVGRLALTEPLQAFYDDAIAAENETTLASSRPSPEAEGRLSEVAKVHSPPANGATYEQLLIELRKWARAIGDRGAVVLFEQSVNEIRARSA